MTGKDHTHDRLTQRARAAARKLSREAEEASEAATVLTRQVAKEAFERIKASRARAIEKD